MTNLKLGPLPKAGTTRVTISLPDPLKEEIDLYAAEHSRIYDPVETAALIPHMLEAFLRSDRGWRSRKSKLAGRLRVSTAGPSGGTGAPNLAAGDH